MSTLITSLVVIASLGIISPLLFLPLLASKNPRVGKIFLFAHLGGWLLLLGVLLFGAFFTAVQGFVNSIFETDWLGITLGMAFVVSISVLYFQEKKRRKEESAGKRTCVYCKGKFEESEVKVVMASNFVACRHCLAKRQAQQQGSDKI